MNTKASLHIATNDDVSAGAIPAPDTGGLTVIICALVVMACFAAPLFLTLPQAMDAVASPVPSIREAAAADAPAPTFHERHPAQTGVDWVDSLEEAQVAQWRMRASD